MERRAFLYRVGGLAGVAVRPGIGSALLGQGEKRSKSDTLLGMYVHTCWPYKHPYAARTWTVEDWRGYGDGLRKIGYNLIIIWAGVEIMPDPLTPSDRAFLETTAKAIDVLQKEFGMLVYTCVCPNVWVNDEVAAKYTFYDRPLYASCVYIDPKDTTAVKGMMKSREDLLRPLAKMDGIAIIDSDLGGYPGAQNADFVDLMDDHRKMLDRLRPGIDLCYWMHVGWQAYSDFYATGNFRWGTPAESEDILLRLKKLDPRPWSITIHTMKPPPNGTDVKLAEKFGLASTSLAFNYGAIEGEPSYPMTNFGGDVAFKAGEARAPGGDVGNAQTHCVQLPNTFAFAHGAKEKPVSDADYVEFANGLIAGQGDLIVRSWQALAGKDTKQMVMMAQKLEALDPANLTPGPLKGLLFGAPGRFISDLVYQLRMKAAYREFLAASEDKVDLEKFRAFVAATDNWQSRHGYQSAWKWPELLATLKKLNSPRINELVAEMDKETINARNDGKTPFDHLQAFLRNYDTHTPRLLAAMEDYVKERQ